jgi:hypothetical protein
MDAALCEHVRASLGEPNDILITRYGIDNTGITCSKNGTRQTGTLQYFKAPSSGNYTFTVKGAGGSVGSNIRAGVVRNPLPGKAAIIKGTVYLSADDNLMILVGQRGENIIFDTTDGTGGGSGGATFVLRQIAAITDSRYQISYLGKYWEILFVAAGGGGTNDSAYMQSTQNGPDAATVLHTPTNYVAFSGSTLQCTSSQSASNATVLGVQQLLQFNGSGTTYVRGTNIAYGGYGGGTAADDSYVLGGGWVLTSGKPSSWAAYGGTVEVASNIADGECTISMKAEVPVDWGYWYTPVVDRALSDCVYGNPKGCLSTTFLNRIECNTEYLKLYMDYLRIEFVWLVTAVDSWTRQIYLKVAELKRQQESLLKLRATGMIRPDTPLIVISTAESKLGYQLLNDMEKILLDIKGILDILKESFLYVGDIFVGDFQYGGE